MQQADGDDERAVIPVGDVDVADAPARERPEEHDAEAHPDDGDQDVDRPFRLRVLLALRDAEGHRRHREQAGELPAVEREVGKRREREPRVPGALHDVVARAHQRGAAEREDHPERVVGADPAEREPGHVEIERRPGELGRRVDADRHADDAPDRGAQQEQADDLVVVGFLRQYCFGRGHDRLGQRGR